MTNFIESRPERNLRIYKQSISHFNPISVPQQNELIARYMNDGDTDARNQVIESYLPYVIQLADEYRTPGISPADIIQQGNLALTITFDHFKLERGVPYASYAIFWIRKFMSDFVKRYNSAVTNSIRNPERLYTRSIDQPADAYEDDDYCLSHTMHNGDDPFSQYDPYDYDILLAADRLPDIIREAINTLSDKEAIIIRYSFGIDHDVLEDADIAIQINVSEAYVRQLRDIALRKLYCRIDKMLIV